VRRQKYGNHRTSDGFDSKHERSEYLKLMALEAGGVISSVERQVVYTLIPSQRGDDGKVVERQCAYKADFRVTYPDGRVEVMDAKGVKTPEYIIKRKLMLFIHGIRVIER
jgi:Protein of unknown function (DUF1064)